MNSFSLRYFILLAIGAVIVATFAFFTVRTLESMDRQDGIVEPATASVSSS